MLLQNGNNGLSGTPAVNRKDAPSPALCGSEDALKYFELDLRMRPVRWRSVEAYFADVAGFIEKSFK
jgi:hypothetical protein